MNDIFMRNVLKKRECAEYILRIIMEMKNLQVVDHIVQKDYKNLQGRSAILDCVARDNKDKRYNVEIQQESEGASPKRARYHSGLLDMNTLNPGQDYEELPESYVIFITRDDVQGKGLPVYHADRVIEETGETFGDGSHIIYVKSSIQDEDTALGRLMHDLHCKNADEMHSEVLAKRVSELKETEGGTGSMCEALEELMEEMREEMRQEGMAQGMAQGEAIGEAKERKKTAKALFQRGMLIKEIAEVISEEEDTVEKWLEVTR
ncbi:MAG: Rpn family recombination-promoting nuclease/putative transposase [Blautia sp.]|nr:Rpn family recombination-promoting nuclease/putative transposase [Blautia sp.]